MIMRRPYSRTATRRACRHKIRELPDPEPGRLNDKLGRLASPLAGAGGPGSRVCGLLAVGWDGTVLEVPASAANVAAMGRQRGAHYPQARLVALVACGTRAVLGAALGAAAERELAGELLGVLGKGMLLLAGLRVLQL